MLLQCTRCGNTEEFIVVPHDYLYLDIVDGEIKVSFEDDHSGPCVPLPAVSCDRCGCEEVEVGDNFWERFWEAYGKPHQGE